MDDFGSYYPSALKKRKILHSSDSGRDRSARDWSGLPRNVLFHIMDRLTVVDDYLRFGAVCRSWRAISLEEIPENKTKRCSQPFLLVASTKARKTQRLILYSLSTKTLYNNFRFRLSRNKYFQGSSFGWLVTMEKKDWGIYTVQLQNPFLSDDHIIDLPPLNDLQAQHVDIEGFRGWYGHYLCKAVLSSKPSSSECFVVVAIMSRYQGLAFFKSGDTAWTSIGDWRKEWGQQMFHDVIFFHKTKQFYALRRNGQVVAIDFQVTGGEEPKLVQVMPPVTLIANAIKAYLVEDLSGDLLVVSKCTDETNQLTNRLIVYKLDLARVKWTEVHNLGDSILFLGKNGSIARSLSECPGCQPNCIYFTEDVHSSYPSKQFHGPPDSGIYNLEDNTTRAHYIGPSRKVLPAPIWLEPTLFSRSKCKYAV